MKNVIGVVMFVVFILVLLIGMFGFLYCYGPAPDDKVGLGNGALVTQRHYAGSLSLKKGVEPGSAIARSGFTLKTQGMDTVTFELTYQKWGEADHTVTLTLSPGQRWEVRDLHGCDSVKITASIAK